MSYRRVRLSDGPDDVGSRELDRLDRGDEVEIVGSFEGFLQVRTPEGVDRLDPAPHDRLASVTGRARLARNVRGTRARCQMTA